MSLTHEADVFNNRQIKEKESKSERRQRKTTEGRLQEEVLCHCRLFLKTMTHYILVQLRGLDLGLKAANGEEVRDRCRGGNNTANVTPPSQNDKEPIPRVQISTEQTHGV